MKMIERIAKAIGDEMCGYIIDDLESLARAAIAAMREPTEEMCQAAMIAAVTEENKGIEYAPMQGWKAMIDEALK